MTAEEFQAHYNRSYSTRCLAAHPIPGGRFVALAHGPPRYAAFVCVAHSYGVDTYMGDTDIHDTLEEATAHYMQLIARHQP